MEASGIIDIFPEMHLYASFLINECVFFSWAPVFPPENMLEEACSNVANYLLFKPYDEDMLENKRLYLKEEGVDESYFTPRQVSC